MRKEFAGRAGLWIFAACALGVAVKLNPINLIAAPILIALIFRSSIKLFVFIFFAAFTWLITPTTRVTPIREPVPFLGVVDVVWMPRGAQSGDSFVVRTLEGKEFTSSYRGRELISLGDRIHIEGRIVPHSEASEVIWLSRNIPGSLRITRLISTISHGNTFWFFGLTARKSFVKFVDQNLPDETAGCVDGICFNVDAEMSPQLLDDLRRSGTIHIISASGLHVVILVAILSRTFVLLPVPRWAQIALLAALLLAYVSAAGMRAPAVRAAAMGVVPLCAFMFRRESDLLSVFGLAGAGFVLLDPTSVLDIGFQLSFVIIAALLLFAPLEDSPPEQAAARLRFRIKQLVISSAVASAAAAPLTAYHFGMFSTVSVIANLFVVPIVEVLMIGALLAFALSGVLASVASVIMVTLVHPLAGWIMACAHFFANLPLAAIYVPPFSGYVLFAIYTLGLLSWKPHARNMDPSRS